MRSTQVTTAKLLFVALAMAAGSSAWTCGSEPDRTVGRRATHPSAPIGQDFGFLQVRSVHRWPSLRGEEHTELTLSALFVRYWGAEEEDVARHLGVSLEEPRLEPGTCELGSEVLPLPDDGWDVDEGEISVELLDAGKLVFLLPGRSELLTGAPYPEVLPNVSGLHYGRTISRLAEPPATQRFNVVGLGGDDVPSFELMSLGGPAELRIMSVAGWIPAEGPLVLSARDSLTVTWQPGQPQLDTLVRLRWGRRGGRAPGELICRPRSQTKMVVPARWLARIPIGRSTTSLQLSVETLSRAARSGPLPGRIIVLVSQSDVVPVQLVR
ncbi:MAG: hypothetical protein ABI333_28050 [bacterium]